jgi:hypothetical protein
MKTQPKTALVIAETHRNKTDYAASAEWQNLLLNIQRNLPPAGKTERITENVWMIPIDTELHFLATLIQCMKSFGIPIRVLFFDETPAWVKNPPSA